MRILVVGSGGREHALAWRLARDADSHELHAAPGNPGIAEIATCHGVEVADHAGLLALATRIRAELVVVGPEAPLVAGLADRLGAAGVRAFGPTAAASRIEGSKTFAKEVMAAAGVATAGVLGAAVAPCVIKADGLAAGKGVFVCPTQPEADEGYERARALGEAVVVEELLSGPEVSVFALCDGRVALGLPAAQDYKRVGDGDTGPNTGGMGSFSPASVLRDEEVEGVLDSVHRPVLAELARRGTPFRGVLFAGLILTDRGPRVLEFNCRFGDPETQSILPRLDGDLAGLLAAAADADLAGREAPRATRHAVTVVMAAAGYPDDPVAGAPIRGLEHARETGAVVFHAGTATRQGELVAGGGRALNVTAVAETLDAARERAYRAVDLVDFPGNRHRRDIAAHPGDTTAHPG